MFLLPIYIILSLFISRHILKANIFNIASFTIIIYWLTYPLERIQIWGMYQTIPGIKERGAFIYGIFGLSFLFGVYFISKINIKKISFYPKINSVFNLFFISFLLGLLGLICFSLTYSFDIREYINIIINFSRSERLAILSTANNALPYSIFFIPSVVTLLLAIKKMNQKKYLLKICIFILIILINTPVFISYIIEGDRTSLIKLGIIILFTLSLNKLSVDKLNKKIYLVENFKINKKVLLNRVKLMLVVFLLFLMLVIVGLGRGNSWKNISRLTYNFTKQIELGLLPTSEFRAVNFTIDYALARDFLSIEKEKELFTWKNLIFYPLPTYVYKEIFNKNKPPNMGDGIGLEIKNYVYGPEIKKKLGFGLSPIAEGLINLGNIGVIYIGIIYGISIGLLQAFFNKISLEKISVFDIVILNTLGIIPLIMRSGSAGIYNWIISSSIVLILPILIIDLFKKDYSRIFKIRNNVPKN